ncbi:trypsin-like peptidase domain-containing protein [Agaribacter flavus]|uniref:Trypsin-like peptidase domain-containing protein n=1 Tax=Agaribacter flavus TaxID=1902781 RepID=A0ABV7FQW0_9ALTE
MIASLVFYSTGSLSNDKVINAVVNIEFNKVTPWDDGYNSSGVGTGFVIDSKQGLILTNKHILNVGPVVAYGEFSNKQKLALTPVYRDPVHDYGVFRYNPRELQDLEIIPIELSTKAQVGDQVRLYGNDGGEALSIIEGVLSRLDRTAPDYNSTTTDYNTFYMQAALGTSGGSSGSPILNESNQAIAINAGGRSDTAAAFFLPMDIILPTIKKVLEGKVVRRGTFQSVLEHIPFNQLSEFGWNVSAITALREQTPEALGRLKVRHIVKNSPAYSRLQVGDLLLSANGQHISNFVQLEKTLNENVGKEIELLVSRDHKEVSLTLEVSDLFKLVPDQYIELGKAVFIPIGLSTARQFNVPVEGVLLTAPGRFFGGHNISSFARLEEINGQAVSSLDSLKKIFQKIPINSTFGIRYRYVYNQKDQEYKRVRNLAPFFINRHCRNTLEKKVWQCENIKFSDEIAQSKKLTHGKPVGSPLVEIEVFRPIEVNINREVIRKGKGVILDINQGLILTNKDIIDSSLSQVNVFFDNGNSSSASVEAIHPYLNMVLIKANLSKFKISKDLIPQVTTERLEEYSNNEVKLIGRTAHQDFTTNVSIDWEAVYYGKTTFDTRDVSYIPDEFSIYINKDGELLAIAPGYDENNGILGIIPSELIGAFINDYKINNHQVFEIKDKFDYISYANAVELGLPTNASTSVERKIYVTKAEELEQSGFASGDIILKAPDDANSLNNLYLSFDEPTENFTILRDGKIQDLSINLRESPYLMLNEVIIWGGAVIHEIPTVISTPAGIRDKCIRVGFRYFGAPLYTAMNVDPICILSIDGHIILNLTDVVNALEGKHSGEFTSVEAIRLDKNFQLSEYQVREENYYWPTLYYKRLNKVWAFEPISQLVH